MEDYFSEINQGEGEDQLYERLISWKSLLLFYNGVKNS